MGMACTHIEQDPSGKDAHEPGAKLDAGKVQPALILDDMPRALLAVAEVGTFGARKYSKAGWLQVGNAIERYRNAGDRHRLKRGFEQVDPDSRLLHLAHQAWNCLAELELVLRQQSASQTGESA